MRGNWGSWDGSPLLLWSFCPCESPSHLLPMSWGLGTCCSLCPSHLSSHGLLPALWPGPPLGLCQPSKLGRSLFCRLLEHPIFFFVASLRIVIIWLMFCFISIYLSPQNPLHLGYRLENIQKMCVPPQGAPQMSQIILLGRLGRGQALLTSHGSADFSLYDSKRRTLPLCVPAPVREGTVTADLHQPARCFWASSQGPQSSLFPSC